MEPEKIHQLLRLISDYPKNWHDHQKKIFPTIDRIIMLDDIVGFMSEAEFMEF